MRKPEELSVKKKGTKNTEAAGSAPQIELDNHQNIVDTVNSWISESRENRRAERIFSDESISAWRLIPVSSNP